MRHDINVKTASERWSKPGPVPAPVPSQVPSPSDPFGPDGAPVEPSHARQSWWLRVEIALVLLVGLVMTVLVLRHVTGVNGPSYWRWHWRELPVTPFVPLMLLSAVPVFGALALRRWKPATPIVIALALVMLGSFAIKLTAMATLQQPVGFNEMGRLVEHRLVTSYYYDAVRFGDVEHWLSDYADVVSLPQISVHTRNKPAGPTLLYRTLIRWLGVSRRTAITCGLVMTALSLLSIPATWWLVRVLSGDVNAALRAAAMLALCPGFALFSPMLDPAYIVLAAGVLGSWHLALTRPTRAGRWTWSVALGVALFATTFMTYSLLVLGAIMLAYAILRREDVRHTEISEIAAGQRARASSSPLDDVTEIPAGALPRGYSDAPSSLRGRFETMLFHGTLALGACAVIYAVMWFLASYNPIEIFRICAANQSAYIARFHRSCTMPKSIVFDLADFALGAGWVIPALAIAALARALRTDVRCARDHTRLLALCLATPLFIACTGLLQCETARTWNFLLPLVLLPAAVELGRLPVRARVATYTAMLVVLLAVGQNLQFMWT